MSRKTILERAKSYRLRMVFNHWYLHLLDEKGIYFAEFGPFGYSEAQREAKKLHLPDEDKRDVPDHQRK